MNNKLYLNDKRFPAKHQEILKRLVEVAKSLPNTSLYLVGGFSRDYVLGKSSNDIDVMVPFNKSGKNEIDAEVIKFLIDVANKIARAIGFSISQDLRNKSIDSIKFEMKSQSKSDDSNEYIKGVSRQGTIVLTDPEDHHFHIDVALARSETYPDPKSRKPEVKPTSFEGDALRRDFTFNTLAADLKDYHTDADGNAYAIIKDPTGKGFADLDRGIIRTPVNPFDTFNEDPLRILRAIRMKNRFGFEWDDTLKEILNDREAMQIFLSRFGAGEKVSMERVNEEINKFLETSNFGNALEELQQFGIMDVINPKIRHLFSENIKQLLNGVNKETDRAVAVALWFSEMEKKIESGEVDLKGFNLHDVLVKQLKYSIDIADDVKRILNNIKLVQSDVDVMKDSEIRNLIRGLTADFKTSKAEEAAAKSRVAFDKIMEFMKHKKDYKGYEALPGRVSELGGIEEIRSGLKLINGLDIKNWGVKGKDIGTVKDEIEYLVKVLGTDEAFVKAQMDSGLWKVRDGRIVDESEESVVDKHKSAMASFKVKLNKVADSLEALMLFKIASKVDGFIKTALESDVDMDERVQASDFNRAKEMLAATEDFRDMVMAWVGDKSLVDKDRLQKRLANFHLTMEKGDTLTDLLGELNTRVILYQNKIEQLGLQQGAGQQHATKNKLDEMGSIEGTGTISDVGKGGHYDDFIMAAAKKYPNVPERLIRAVIMVESSGRANAVSPTGATGLMQLTRGTAKDMGVDNRKDPEQNIIGGTRYLSMLMEKYEGNIEKVLGAYNGGLINVDRGIWTDDMIDYIKKMRKLYPF